MRCSAPTRASFVPPLAECRQAVLVLAMRLHWSLTELLALTPRELFLWLGALNDLTAPDAT